MGLRYGYRQRTSGIAELRYNLLGTRKLRLKRVPRKRGSVAWLLRSVACGRAEQGHGGCASLLIDHGAALGVETQRAGGGREQGSEEL